MFHRLQGGPRARMRDGMQLRANARWSNGDPVTDDDTNTVPIDQNPAIQIVKTNEGVTDGGGPL